MPYQVIFTNQEIVIHIEDIPAREVEIAIRLYDGENVIVNEEPDEIPESNLEKTFYYVQTIFIPLLPVLIGGGILQAIIILVYNLDFFQLLQWSKPHYQHYLAWFITICLL